MNRFRRNCLAVVTSSVLMVIGVMAAPTTTQAAATVPFGARFTANANGSIVTVGNNVMTCPSVVSTCAAAKNGALYDNNNYNMINLDADSDSSTFNSSMSTLSLPAGATVLWAGLYWGARLTAGTSGTAASGNYNQMSLKLPGAASYQTITASTAANAQFGPNSASGNAYQRFAIVTSLVSQAGSGDYWGANVVAGTGSDRYAGWSLVVAYSAPGMPLRNLTVFDGFNIVDASSPQTITVSGFTAPQDGPVNAQIGIVAYEGDLSLTGDYAQLNGTQLGTALSSGSDFFNSTDDANGTSVATRTPADQNMLGFDIKNVTVSGVIPNAATTATFRFASNGDVYFPGVLTTAIDLYAPDFSSSWKTATDLSGHSPAQPGDIIQYTVNYTNTGQDPSRQTISEDPIPAGTQYVPGSLALISGGATTALTDASSDDVGEFTGSSVRVRVGDGATSSAGGQINLGASAAYSFQVQVTPAAAGQTLTNIVHLAYVTATTGIASTYDIAPVTTAVVAAADVAITKTLSPRAAGNGQPITATLTVTNNGPGTASGVQVSDPIIDGWQDVTADVSQAPGTSCSTTQAAGASMVVCAVPDLPIGTSAVIALTGTMPPDTDPSQSSLTNVARVSTASYDPDQTNNVSSDTIQIGPQADLTITKTADAATVTPGGQVTYSLSVTNNGPSDATSVTISDSVLSDSTGTLSLTGVTPSAPVTCGALTALSVSCAIDSLPVGQSAVLTVVGQVATNAAAGASFTNTAVVGSSTPDPDPGNNSSAVTGTAGTASADVRLAKTIDPTTLIAGTPVTYTITATNYGPSDATGVVVQDVVPSAITIANAVSDHGACTSTGQNVSCPVGTLAAGLGIGSVGAQSVITIQGIVSADATNSSVTNDATVAASSPDPDLSNNSAAVTAPVSDQADLSVTKTANTTTLPTDTAPVDYTITIHNNGPSVARNVSLDDLVPDGLDFDTADLPSGVNCGTFTSGDATHSAWNCTFGDLGVGADSTIVLHTTANQTITAPVTETATVTSDTPDNATGNNTATWTLTDQPFADLSITKTATATSFNAGQTGTYQLSVSNAGTDPAVPTITDTLPTGLTLLAAGATGSQTSPECTADGQQVTCTRADPLAQGDSPWTVTLTTAVSPDLADGSIVSNSAHVTGDILDPATGNNDSTATVPVVAQANLTATGMEWDSYDGLTSPVGAQLTTPLPAGSFVWLTMTFENTGTATAQNSSLLLSYNMPMSNISVGQSPLVIWNDDSLSADSPDADCVLVTGGLQCPVWDSQYGTSVPPGSTVTVHMLLVALPDAPPTTDSAHFHVATSTRESNLADNDGSAQLTIGPGATNLTMHKTAAAGSGPNGALIAGGTFSYTMQVQQPPCEGQYNNGGNFCAAVPNATVSDPLPDGFHATSVATSQGTCTIGPDDDSSISCDIGTVPGTLLEADTPPSPPIMVTVYGTIDPGVHGQDIPNTGSVNAEQPNPSDYSQTVPIFSSYTALVDVVQEADLRLYKYVDPSASQTDSGLPIFYAGNEVGYTLTAVNAGPSASGASTITDTLPVGLSLDPANSPGCQVATAGTTSSGEVVTCAVGDLAVGQSQLVRVMASTLPLDLRQPGTGPGCVPGQPSDPSDPLSAQNAAGCDNYQTTPRELDNTASIAADDSAQIDPSPDNNTAAVAAELETKTDLAITAQAGTSTPAAGGTLTYTVVSVDNGPSAADSPFTDMQFPPGFTVQSWSVPGNTCQLGQAGDPAYSTLHCEPVAAAPLYQVFQPGQAVTGVVTVSIPDDASPGTYTMTAHTASQTPEDNYANNTATVAVTVQQVSDTTVTKTLVSPDPLVAGQPGIYRLTVTNNGPSVADNVVVSDTVPVGMTYVSATDASGTACPNPEVREDQTVVECSLGTMEVGATTSVTVTLRPDASTVGTQVCNRGLVGSASIDLLSGNNESDACSTVVPPSADIAVTLTANQAAVNPGGYPSFTARVTNNGPDPATAVTATFAVPAGLTGATGVFVSDSDGTSREATCTLTGQQMVCNVGNVAVGQSVTYRVTGVAATAAGTQLTLAVAVAHPETDPTSSNNQAQASVNVVAEPVANLAVSKSVSPSGQAKAGDVLTYTLTFANSGTAAADVAYIDDLSDVVDDATIGAVTAGDGLSAQTDLAANQLVVTGSVGSGQTVTVSYPVTVKADGSRGDSVVFNAAFPADTPVTDRPNQNTPPDQCPACTTTTVVDTPVPDLKVSKSVSPSGQAKAGDVLTYTLTFANSGTAAAGVDYTDDLSDVTDDATLGVKAADVSYSDDLSGDAADTAPAVARDGAIVAISSVTTQLDESAGHLVVTGTVAPGQTVTVTYWATVKADGDRGNSIVFNAAFPSDTPVTDRPNRDTPADQCPACTTTTVVPGPTPLPPEKTTLRDVPGTTPVIPSGGSTPVWSAGQMAALLLVAAGTACVLGIARRRDRANRA